MIIAILLAAAEPMTAIEAERSFVLDAQKIGQWTAFRKYAAEDGVLFVPQQVGAQAFLKDQKDPPVSIYWWPGASFVSCDGSFAVNTGPWVGQAGVVHGYFTTVWRRRGQEWRWIYDGGDYLKQPRAQGSDVKPQVAACTGKPTGAKTLATGSRGPVSGEQDGLADQAFKSGYGESADGTLVWSWTVGPQGERHFLAQLWDGAKFLTVIEDVVAAPPK